MQDKLSADLALPDNPDIHFLHSLELVQLKQWR